MDYYTNLAEAYINLEKCAKEWLDAAPLLEQKLTKIEEESSIEDGLNYTAAEIESIVFNQIKNHPINKDLEQALERVEEAVAT